MASPFLCTIPTQNRFACLPVYNTLDSEAEEATDQPVSIVNQTEGAPSPQKRGRQESVLNSPSKNPTKIGKPPSAAEPKPFNAISINRIGPKLFDVVRGIGSKRQMDIPLVLENQKPRPSIQYKPC